MYFNYNIQCHFMKNVLIHGITNTKNSSLINNFTSFCSLYSPVCVSLMYPLTISKNIFKPFSTVSLFRLGNILLKSFAMFVENGCHNFRKQSLEECRKLGLLILNYDIM